MFVSIYASRKLDVLFPLPRRRTSLESTIITLALHLSTAVNTMFFSAAGVTAPNQGIKKARIGGGEEMKRAQLSCLLISHTWSSTNK